MAFGDASVTLYNGKIRLDYKNGAHRYYVRERVNYELDENDPKAWGKIIYPKGTTTLLGDTLEKKGLMTWALGMAMKELFGFYDFVGDDGKHLVGFSKGVGTMWNSTIAGDDSNNRQIVGLDGDKDVLPLVVSANKAWTKHQKKGGDIGTIVHQAVESFILLNHNTLVQQFDKKGKPKGKPCLPEIIPPVFDIAEQYMWNIKENTDIDSPEFATAMEEFESDVAKAKLAFDQFVIWWTENRPVLHEAENLLYSIEHNICGTDDFFITLNDKKILGDLKTSNASTSASAPEGVYYSYFIQLTIYELIRREMGLEHATDLMCVSCRKDGQFSIIFASELGFDIESLIDWALAVIKCYRYMETTKKALDDHAKTKEV